MNFGRLLGTVGGGVGGFLLGGPGGAMTGASLGNSLFSGGGGQKQGGGGGGIMDPKQMIFDPTNPAVAPLQQQLASMFMQQMTGAANYAPQNLPNTGNMGSIFDQLYGASGMMNQMGGMQFGGVGQQGAQRDPAELGPISSGSRMIRSNVQPYGVNEPAAGGDIAGQTQQPPQATGGNGGATAQGGSSTRNPFDLPVWQGPYSAALTTGQLDALKGFDNLARSNPVAQTLNQINQAGTGVQGLGNAFSGAGNTGYQTMEKFANGQGFDPTRPQVSDLSKSQGVNDELMNFQLDQSGVTPWQNLLQGFASNAVDTSGLNPASSKMFDLMNQQFGFSDMSRANSMLDQSNALAQNFSNFSPATNFLSATANGANNPQLSNTGNALNTLDAALQNANSRSDMSSALGFLQNTINGNPLQQSDRSTSNAFLQNLFGAGGGTTAQTSELTNSLMGQMNNALNTGGFDQTEMFKAGKDVFSNDLAREQARLREEMSNLGLGAGSSDRLDVLSRNAGDSLAKFNLGQQQIAQQSFEDAANRKLQGIGVGQNLAQLTQLPLNQQLAALPALQQNEGLGFSEQLAGLQAKLGAVNPLMQGLTQNTQEAMQAAQLGLGASGQALNIANLPFAQQMQQLQTQIGATNPLISAIAQGGQERQNAAQLGLGAAGQRAANDQVNFGQQLGAAGFGLNAAQGLAQNEQARLGSILQDNANRIGAANMGAGNELSMIQNILANNQNRLAASNSFANNAQIPFAQQMAMIQGIDLPGAQMALNAGGMLNAADQQGMAAGLGALNQQGNMLGMQFGMNDQARQVADQDILRRMQAQQAAQGGALGQALGFMQTVPGLSMGLGPSTASQIGSLIGNLPWAQIEKLGGAVFGKKKEA